MLYQKKANFLSKENNIWLIGSAFLHKFSEHEILATPRGSATSRNELGYYKQADRYVLYQYSERIR